MTINNAVAFNLPLLKEQIASKSNTLTPLVNRVFERVGRAIQVRVDHLSDTVLQASEPDLEALVAQEQSNAASSQNNASLSEWYTEADHPDCLYLDPKKWKEQDHYLVLGLEKLRYKASDEHIKQAYQLKVLRHHPDKKAASGKGANDDAFFKCIQKANEILSDPVKRRQFDSVDPTFDETVPSEKKKGDFYEIYGPVFASNGRFSTKQPVPELGNADSSRDDVEQFYHFFYHFDSWRTFEYLDEEEKSAGDNRDDKRYQEKKNKNARAKRKQEDNQRMIQLVEQAMRLDPRVQLFKQQDREQRDSKKNARERAAQVAAEEARKAAEEAKILAEKSAEEAKVQAAEQKKQKEAAKNAQRREKKTIKQSFKDHGYFIADATDPVQMDAAMQQLDALLEKLQLDDLMALRVSLSGEKAAAEEAYKEALAGKRATAEQVAALRAAEEKSKAEEEKSISSVTWTPHDVKLLVKAIQLFPGGTLQRWETVADHVRQHAEHASIREMKGTAAVLAQYKHLQTAGGEDAEQLQRFENKVDPRIAASGALPDGAEQFTIAPPGAPWRPDEQQRLEAALRQHPASLGAARWPKVAQVVKSRDATACAVRFKTLAAQLKKK